jgi:RimJ/RimL family protein N-acetyltransferase
VIVTPRLRLRPWRDEDAAAHAALVADPLVRATLGPPPADSMEVVRRQQALQAELGHCFWVLEPAATGRFAGWSGLKPGRPPIAGELEIGWTVAPALWGQGLAREAAAAVLAWAWATLAVPQVTAITSVGNVRSRALMERLGMTRYPDEDFAAADVADAALRPHVVYRIARP